MKETYRLDKLQGAVDVKRLESGKQDLNEHSVSKGAFNLFV